MDNKKAKIDYWTHGSASAGEARHHIQWNISISFSKTSYLGEGETDFRHHNNDM